MCAAGRGRDFPNPPSGGPVLYFAAVCGRRRFCDVSAKSLFLQVKARAVKLSAVKKDRRRFYCSLRNVRGTFYGARRIFDGRGTRAKDAPLPLRKSLRLGIQIFGKKQTPLRYFCGEGRFHRDGASKRRSVFRDLRKSARLRQGIRRSQVSLRGRRLDPLPRHKRGAA